MPAGRPTLLTPELIEKAKGYLATCVDYEDQWERIRTKLPSIEGLSIYLDCARESLTNWSTEESDLGKAFLGILEDIRKEQASRLLNSGLDGSYNSTIAKLILGKHGYVDEKHNDHTSGGKPIPILGDVIK